MSDDDRGAPRDLAEARPIPEIRAASVTDAAAFAEHVLLHSSESGLEGSPHFALSRAPAADEVRDGARARWTRRLTEPLWGRAWLLWVPVEAPADPGADRGVRGFFPAHGRPRRRVVGHLELRGGRVHAELHRAVLAMGIQRAFTGQGHGQRLIEVAVRWARDEAKLAWIDLGVFAHNEPARKLYRRMGFVEQGLHRDAFRLDAGLSVDDIQMTLEL